MELKLAVICLTILMLFCSSGLCHPPGSNDSLIVEEARLLKWLFEDQTYDKYARPVLKTKDTVNMTLGMNLVQIVDLDEKSQILTLSLYITKSWTDIQLQWHPEDFGGVSHIRVPISKLWKPDIVLYNSAAEEYKMTFEANAVVYSSGMVLWVPHAMVKVYCQLDMSRFPFDEQKCELKFGSWTYDGFMLNMEPSSYNSAEVSSTYILSGEWDVTSWEAKKNVKYYACCKEPYPDVTYTIGLKRVSVYHRYMFLFPVIMLCILTMFLFVLPPESGEKVNLGIGIVLAYVFMLLMLENYLPTELTQVPMIGAYYCFNLVMVVLSIIISMFVLNMCVRGPRRGSAPNWLKSLVHGKLGSLCCVREERYSPLVHFEHRDDDEAQLTSNIVRNNDTDEMTDLNTNKLDKTLTEILRYLKSSNQDPRPSPAQVNQDEWYKAALMLDRIALILYIIVCIIGSICILL
ncbi:unnamed protein product [Owenia fusiformis]|uniref:Uncharacterized protein n=1 Tax=Owenia fusiformis TaxID=6347 RepID=A0A8J1XPL2_OWEFU|nr:unnamed protein product [Owenia fusiformis]